jgi:hypothetical protein
MSSHTASVSKSSRKGNSPTYYWIYYKRFAVIQVSFNKKNTIKEDKIPMTVKEIKETSNCKQEEEIIFLYSVSKYLQDTEKYHNFFLILTIIKAINILCLTRNTFALGVQGLKTVESNINSI